MSDDEKALVVFLCLLVLVLAVVGLYYLIIYVRPKLLDLMCSLFENEKESLSQTVAEFEYLYEHKCELDQEVGEEEPSKLDISQELSTAESLDEVIRICREEFGIEIYKESDYLLLRCAMRDRPEE